MPDDTGAVLLSAPPFDVDELAHALVDRMAKASVPGLGQLPRGTTTTDLADEARTLSAAVDTGDYSALPRELLGAFSPGVPLLPARIDPRLATGRTEPRVSQFPVSWNLQFSSDRLVSWDTLRRVADQVDVVRRCIEVRKAQLVSLEWDITMSPAAIESVMAEQGEISPGKASKIARARYAQDIARVSRFWEEPDRMNDLDFPTWLTMLLEEHFVLDAIALYPRQTFAGELHSFEVLDGTTIKPLLDHRGGVPRPPLPAFQQILYGFPRGEFVASDVDVDKEFARDRLIYRRRYARTFTPYGFSNVEQALSAANSYLKRMAWLTAEFDEGTLPDTFIETDMKVTDPNQLQLWELVLNDALAGDVGARKGLKFLPAGMTPSQMQDMAMRYSPDLDELFIKICCMCFDVMPTEIGFPPKSGIGGKGHQEGEESSSYRKGVRPTVTWLQSFFTKISRTYLNMPDELQFTFLGYQQEDQKELEEIADSRTRGGRATINEERAAQGRPLWDFPEADTPFVVTGSGIVFLEGAIDAQARDAGGTAPEAVETPPAVDAPPASATDPRAGDELVDEELTKFAGYARRRSGAGRWRNFTFKTVGTELAGLLNGWGELAALGDVDALDEIRALTGQEEAA